MKGQTAPIIKNEKERNIERYCVVQCTKRGWHCWKLSSAIRRGIPDRLIITRMGTMGFAELKKPKGGQTKGHQNRLHRDLKDRGVIVAVPHTKQDVDHLVAQLEKKDAEKTVPAKNLPTSGNRLR